MRRALAIPTILLALAPALAVAGCGAIHEHDHAAGTTAVAVRRAVVLTREELPHTWPVTVDAGAVACHVDAAVTFTAGGRSYALNEVAEEDGFDSIVAIETGGKSRAALLDRGLALCGGDGPPAGAATG